MNLNTLITDEKLEELQDFLFNEVKTTRFISMIEGWRKCALPDLANQKSAILKAVDAIPKDSPEVHLTLRGEAYAQGYNQGLADAMVSIKEVLADE